MMNRMIPIAAFAALMLTGCQETSSDTAKDVAEARQDAAEDSAEARHDANDDVAQADDKVADAQQAYANADEGALRKLTKVESEAMIEKAKAAFDVASTEASGRHKVAKEKCGALTGVDKDACLSTADATLAAEQAAATASRDAALVDAANHE